MTDAEYDDRKILPSVCLKKNKFQPIENTSCCHYVKDARQLQQLRVKKGDTCTPGHLLDQKQIRRLKDVGGLGECHMKSGVDSYNAAHMCTF